MSSAELTYLSHSDSEHAFFHCNTINTLQSIIFLPESEACQTPLPEPTAQTERQKLDEGRFPGFTANALIPWHMSALWNWEQRSQSVIFVRDLLITTPPLDPVHIQVIFKRDTIVCGLVVRDTRVVQMRLVTFPNTVSVPLLYLQKSRN